MKLFIDSSALAKRYVEETGSREVQKRCREASEIILSVITGPELLSGLNRLKREQKLPVEKYNELKKLVMADLSKATIINLTENILQETVNCLESTSIRTLDAIQVASAKEMSCDLFLSADHRQCESAKAMGLPVEKIG